MDPLGRRDRGPRAPRRVGPGGLGGAALALALAGALALPAGAGERSLPDPEEPTSWHWWWHLNKDAYLDLRATVFDASPVTGSSDFSLGIGERERPRDFRRLSDYEVRLRIVPALLAGLEDEPPDGVIGTILFALAKIGTRGEVEDETPFVELFLEYVDHPSKLVRDRAVVALGILGDPDAAAPLLELVTDDRAAHARLGLGPGAGVPNQTRAYAAYALGLLVSRGGEPEYLRDVARALLDVLEGPELPTDDVKVACVTALGLTPLLPLDGEPVYDPRRPRRRGQPTLDPLATRRQLVGFLMEVLDDERGYHSFVRAHVPNAVVRLLEGVPADEREAWRAEVVPPLLRILGRYSDARNELKESAVRALGQLGDADEDRLDREIRDTLLRVVLKEQRQTRFFCHVALARLAARPGRGEEPGAATESLARFFVRRLRRAESREEPWIAVAMGVLCRELRDRRRAIPPDVVERLADGLDDCASSLDAGAWALGVGLARDLEGLPILLEKLAFFDVEQSKGLVALGLGLMGDSDGRAPVRAVVRDSVFRPEQLELASQALGLMRDRELVPQLEELLGSAESAASQGPLVSALGWIGDRRAIDVLLRVLADDVRFTDAARAEAADALGVIADKDDLPWRSRISSDVNHRARTVTLLEEGAGEGILTLF